MWICFVLLFVYRGGASNSNWTLWGNSCCVVWFASAWNKSDLPLLPLSAYSWNVFQKFIQLSKHLILWRAKLPSYQKATKLVLAGFNESVCLWSLCPQNIFQMFLIKLISPTSSSSMLNQKQPDYNTFVKELAQGLLAPLQCRGCWCWSCNCNHKYRPCI